MPNRENDITTLFRRNIRVIESAFVLNIFEAFSNKKPEEMDFNGKLLIINFDHLENKNWGASDFLAVCEQTPMVLLDNLKTIDLSDRNLARRFILFIGNNFFVKQYKRILVNFVIIFNFKMKSTIIKLNLL